MEKEIFYSNQISIIATDFDVTIRFSQRIPTINEQQGNIEFEIYDQKDIVLSLEHAEKFAKALNKNLSDHKAKVNKNQ